MSGVSQHTVLTRPKCVRPLNSQVCERACSSKTPFTECSLDERCLLAKSRFHTGVGVHKAMNEQMLTTQPVTTDNPTVPNRSTEKRGRRGGRGCRQCGSHHTALLGKVEQVCRDCGEVWSPCAPYCRGYRCDLHDDGGPTIIGCPDCGVPTKIARHWPEAWRALARELDKDKQDRLDGSSG